MKYTHYNHLAELFDFPSPSLRARGRELLGFLREGYPEAAVEVQGFLEGIPESTLDLQELFTRTFDVQSITTLDIGYVLFGDDYKRAELLSNLTRENKTLETDCRGELADHLPNILRLLAVHPDSAMLEELVREILVPALLLMIREFDSGRIEKKNVSYQKHYKTLIESAPGERLTVYSRALKGLLEVLIKDFQVTEMIERLENWSSRRQSADFLGQVEKEMEIEKNANPVNSGCDS